MVLGWLVLAVMTGVSGSTPGKSAVGLRVVHHGTGTPIGVGPALVRSFVLAAASLPTFGIGLATLAWTAVEDRGRQRRGWHDHLASSVVVDVRPVEEVAESVDDSPRHVVNLTAMRLIPAPAPEAPVFQAPPPLTRPAPEARPPQAPAAPAPQQPAQMPAQQPAPPVQPRRPAQQPAPQPPHPQQPPVQRPPVQQPQAPVQPQPAPGSSSPSSARRPTTRAAPWSARVPAPGPPARPRARGGG